MSDGTSGPVDDPPEPNGPSETDQAAPSDVSGADRSSASEEADARPDDGPGSGETGEADDREQSDGESEASARNMTVNVGIVTALVLTPLVWVLLEGALTLASHHPGTWQLRLVTVGVVNLLFWTALGVDESRDDDWVGLAAVGWLLVLLPLWVLTEAAVVVLDLSAVAGLAQTYLRLAISGLSAVIFGVLLDRRRVE